MQERVLWQRHARSRQRHSLIHLSRCRAVCGDRQFADDQNDTLLNPTFLAEILSPSSEAYDRGRKSEHYRQIESLAEYLLMAQDRLHVDLYTRQPDETWSLKEASRPGETLELRSIECVIPLADLYEKAGF